MARKPNPEAGKRHPMNMRTTRELRERIIAAAHASGRSLVAEVEYRLERSFEKENEARLIEAVATAAATAAFKMVPFGKSPQSAGQESQPNRSNISKLRKSGCWDWRPKRQLQRLTRLLLD
jgi:hypothetical protein